jgi:hypothetical protein
MTPKQRTRAWIVLAMLAAGCSPHDSAHFWNPEDTDRRDGYVAGYRAAADSLGLVRTRCDSLMDTPGAVIARAYDLMGVRYAIVTFDKSGITSRTFPNWADSEPARMRANAK